MRTTTAPAPRDIPAGRRRRALASLLLAAAAAAPLLLSPAPASAQTTGTRIPAWQAWDDFLAGHPELTKQTAGGGRLALGARGAAALAAGGGALEAGAFAAGYYVGQEWIGPWLFGPVGDERHNMTPLDGGNGRWVQTGGDPQLPVPPAPWAGPAYGLRGCTTVNWDGAYSALTYRMTTMQPTTRQYSISTGETYELDPSFFTNATGLPCSKMSIGYGVSGIDLPTGWVLHRLEVLRQGAPLFEWVYDPPMPWTIIPTLQCSGSDGTTATVTGPPMVVPDTGPNVTPVPVPLPDCPSTIPDAYPQILTVDGGRDGETVPLWAAPIPDGNTDPNGVPWTLPQGQPAPQGDPNTDPGGNPNPTPTPTPTATPGPGGQPSTGTNPGTAPNPGLPTSPETDGCWGTGWSWNPVSWVYVPIKCALTWAFVPSPGAVANVKAEAAGLTGSVPFSYFGDVVGWLGGAQVPDDCLTMDVPVPAVWDGADSLRVLDMCNPAGRPEQILVGNVFGVSVRLLLEIAVWAAFLMPIAWWAWGAYAPGSTGTA